MSLKMKMGFVLGSALLFVMFSNCSEKLSPHLLNQSSLTNASINPNTEGTPDGGTNPGTVTETINPLLNYGKMDSACLDTATYDACIFFKSPVAQNKAPLSQILRVGTDLYNLQTYGVALQNRLLPSELKSNSIRVYASSGTPPQFVNGKLRSEYSKDVNKSWVAQIMTYFYLTTLEKEFIRRVGNFFAADRAIEVDAYSTINTGASPTKGNAYYSKSQNKIVLGYATDEAGTGVAHEMALSSEAYVHEMGHANIRHATTSDLNYDANVRCAVGVNGVFVLKDCTQVLTTDKFLAKACATQMGCASAINEGQADFHVLMMFPENTEFFETIENRVTEILKTTGVPRNVSLSQSWTVTQFWDRSNINVNTADGVKSFKGEIHYLGSAYASILWEIYSHPDMKRNHFEKMFNEHLRMITVTTDFRGAMVIFLSLANNMKAELDNKNYGPLITSIFSKRGIQ